jgi:Mrp family chromosome partitioning ATPase
MSRTLNRWKKPQPLPNDERPIRSDEPDPVRRSADRQDTSSPLVSRHERRSRVTTGQMTPNLPLVESVIPGSVVHGPVRDEELKLVQRVFLASGSTHQITVLFAAVEQPGDIGGICARAAEILAAQVEGSVCLVDANVRRPSLHSCFGRELTSGLTEVLQYGGTTSGFMRQQLAENLWLLTSGSPVAEPHILFASDRVRSLFKHVREQFDYVLVSAPPLAESAESILLGQLTDGVVLVVEAHATRRERARRVKESLDAAQVPLLGVVLNNRRFPIPEALYRRL